MHINQLEYFTATIENGSFFAAAKKVYLTPQAIEKAIHNLEQEIGGTLFEPAGRSYQPTHLGKTLYEPALEAIANIDRIYDIACSQASLPSNNGTMTIAVALVPHRCNWFPPEVFGGFKKRHPDVLIDVGYGSTASCLAAVKEGKADAAVSIGPAHDHAFQCRRLFSFPMMVATSNSHPLARTTNSLSLRDIVRHPIAAPIGMGSCRKIINRAFEDAGVLPRFVSVDSGSEAAFLASGGIVLVASKGPIEAVAPGVEVRGLAERERILLPVYYVENQGESHALSRQLASYLALAGDRMRKLQC